MINHIVFLQFKSQLSDADIQLVFQALGTLVTKVPGILHYSYGKNCSHEHLDKGFLHGFVMQFANQQTRNAYIDHPEHRRVATEVIHPALERGLDSVVVLDYEFIP